MKVLVTGAYGIVGLAVVKELARRGFQVKAFDLLTFKNKRLSRKLPSSVERCWGDITDGKAVRQALGGVEAVIHLAAIIPPLADKKPILAERVNVGGTQNLLKAMGELTPLAPLYFTSSIAVYGDRLMNPFIKLTDPLNPNPDDHYAKHKIQCEELIKTSGLKWCIFRLSYIVSERKLKMDPIMFDIPLDTCFEICDARDVAWALAEALTNKAVLGKILQIAGGPACRITYREYLKRMFKAYGLGTDSIPEHAFKKSGFHCGFMDTSESQALLHYQHITLEDYLQAVEARLALRRFFIRLFRRIAQRFVFKRSPYYRLLVSAT